MFCFHTSGIPLTLLWIAHEGFHPFCISYSYVVVGNSEQEAVLVFLLVLHMILFYFCLGIKYFSQLGDLTLKVSEPACVSVLVLWWIGAGCIPSPAQWSIAKAPTATTYPEQVWKINKTMALVDLKLAYSLIKIHVSCSAHAHFIKRVFSLMIVLWKDAEIQTVARWEGSFYLFFIFCPDWNEGQVFPLEMHKTQLRGDE